MFILEFTQIVKNTAAAAVKTMKDSFFTFYILFLNFKNLKLFFNIIWQFH